MKHSHGYLQKMKQLKGKLAAVMTNLAESLRQIAALIQPFMTNSPKQIIEQFGLSEELFDMGYI